MNVFIGLNCVNACARSAVATGTWPTLRGPSGCYRGRYGHLEAIWQRRVNPILGLVKRDKVSLAFFDNKLCVRSSWRLRLIEAHVRWVIKHIGHLPNNRLCRCIAPLARMECWWRGAVRARAPVASGECVEQLCVRSAAGSVRAAFRFFSS